MVKTRLLIWLWPNFGDEYASPCAMECEGAVEVHGPGGAVALQPGLQYEQQIIV
jgi:hypothetical protein